MQSSEAAFITELLAKVPELRPRYLEHLDDNFGELLPHVFFGRVTAWAVEQHAATKRGSAAAEEALTRLLNFLESGYPDGDSKVQNLIAVSFLENLPNSREENWEIRRRLGPALAPVMEQVNF
jgi:hypothetical protein